MLLRLVLFIFYLIQIIDYTYSQIVTQQTHTVQVQSSGGSSISEEERIVDLLGISPSSLTKLPRLVDYFDKINVDRQLNNKDFVESQIKCLVYDGPCGIFGRRAKVLLPAVILDNCRLCSHDQKNKLSRVVVHLQQNYPGAWRDALVKYGGAPKFITAGHVAPQTSLFGPVHSHSHPHGHIHSHIHITQGHRHHPSTQATTNNLVPNPNIPVQIVPSTTSTLMIPIMMYNSPSSPPEPIPAVESPSTSLNYEPTLSPYKNGNGETLTSTSARAPSSPVMESTLDFKPTTIQSAESATLMA